MRIDKPIWIAARLASGAVDADGNLFASARLFGHSAFFAGLLALAAALVPAARLRARLRRADTSIDLGSQGPQKRFLTGRRMAPAERILYTQPMGEFDSYIRAHRERRAAAAVEAVVRAREARAAVEAAARRIGERLGVRRVVLFGSLVRGRFHDRSDIDLAIEGLPEGKLTDAMALAEEDRRFQFGIVPLEAAFDYIRAAVEREGIQLWPR